MIACWLGLVGIQRVCTLILLSPLLLVYSRRERRIQNPELDPYNN